jgi:cobalamin biosynthesis Mg chelatase CobN
MLRTYSLRIVVIGLLLITHMAIHAQPTDAEISTLQAAKLQATATFLDSAQPLAARLKAADGLGYPTAETFNELLRVGQDRTDEDVIRLVALKRYRYDQDYIDTVLNIIADATESDEFAAGLIEDISRRTTFRQPAEIRQRLQSALRERLTDSRDAVRLAAYRALVSSHDALAIDQLVESLRSGGPVPIPLADAIELLDVDGPNKHLVTVRPFLENPDSSVQAQAARVLAVDSDSRQDVVDLAFQSTTPREVRLNALRALSREDEQYMTYALRLMANRSEDADVRYAAMRGGMVRLNYHNEPADSQVRFAIGVQSLSGQPGVVTSDDLDVGAEAKRLIAHLRRYFPAVKKHFARR